MDELSERFQDQFTRIENGRVNEPVTIAVTNKFPSCFFQVLTVGIKPTTNAERRSNNIASCMSPANDYNIGNSYQCSNNKFTDCVLIRQSSYRYFQVLQYFFYLKIKGTLLEFYIQCFIALDIFMSSQQGRPGISTTIIMTLCMNSTCTSYWMSLILNMSEICCQLPTTMTFQVLRRAGY